MGEIESLSSIIFTVNCYQVEDRDREEDLLMTALRQTVQLQTLIQTATTRS